MMHIKYISIYPRNEGKPFGWSVDFDDAGLSQWGHADTLDAAMGHVQGAIQNASVETREAA